MANASGQRQADADPRVRDVARLGGDGARDVAAPRRRRPAATRPSRSDPGQRRAGADPAEDLAEHDSSPPPPGQRRAPPPSAARGGARAGRRSERREPGALDARLRGDRRREQHARTRAAGARARTGRAAEVAEPGVEVEQHVHAPDTIVGADRSLARACGARSHRRARSGCRSPARARTGRGRRRRRARTGRAAISAGPPPVRSSRRSAPPSGLGGTSRRSRVAERAQRRGDAEARISSGIGARDRARPPCSEEAITTKRSAAAATIFSRVCAPPPPLTTQPSGAIWSAPSIAMSSRSSASNGSTGEPERARRSSVATTSPRSAA